MNIDDKIKASETRIFKAIFPNTTNHYDTLFGGTALQLMDEVAFITATRFTRKKVVTVSSDKVNFSSPIQAGTIAEFVGTVSRIGKTSLQIDVSIFVEEMYTDKREKAVGGTFSFVALDEDKKPTSVL